MLADRSIRTKVLSGMGTVLLLLVAGSGYSQYALSRIDAANASIQDARGQAALAGEIDRTFADMRFKAARFIATGTGKEAVEDSLGTARTLLATASQAVAAPQLAAEVKAMAQRFDGFSADWSRVASLRAERDMLIGQSLNVASSKVRTEASFLAARTAASEKPETGFVAGKIIEFVSDLRMSIAQIAAGRAPQAREQADAATAQIETRIETLVRQLDGMQEGSLAGKFGRSVAALKEIYLKVDDLGRELGALETDRIETAIIDITDRAGTVRAGAETQARTLQVAADELLAATERTLTIGAGLLLLLGAAIAWAIGNSIARPVMRLSDAMRAIAGGRLDIEVPHAGRRDEVGAMAGTLRVFRESLREGEALRAAEVERARNSEAERRRQTEALAGSFEQAIGGIVRTVAGAARDLESSAQSLNSASRQASDRTGQAMAAARQASDSVVRVAASAEELSASIGEIDRQVTDSARIAKEAVGEIDRTAAEVKMLSGSAQRIGEVVGLISGIAAQTNLLALNATIEAARAGEAGRGFAVVAAEVKQLADQTARATADISEQVAGIQDQTARAVTAIGGISQVIDRMSRTSAAVMSAVEQQNGATREIAGSVQVAADGTRAVTANIGEVAQVSDRSSADATQMLAASRGVAEQAGRLSQELEGFLRSVRAG